MEREQKKLLLVAVSVGVFLLVTITVAIVILPKVQPQGTAFSSSLPVQPAGRIQITENKGVPLQPIINNSQETNIVIDGNPDATVAVDRDNGDSLTILIPRPNAAAVPETIAPTSQPSSRSVTETASAPAASRPAQTAPAQTQTTAAAPRTTAANQQVAVSRTAAPARATPARTTNDFWIQTGAFTAIVRAEDARELLASRGFTSIIENREIDGRVWYRVRLGPYTSEREANYWLALVKSIEGFGESQVRQTIRQL